MKLAVLFHRFGPYHVARLTAAAKLGPLVGVELSGRGGEYAWAPVETDAFERVVVNPSGDTNLLPEPERTAKVEAALDRANPDVLAVGGYSDAGMLAAARWALGRGKPTVLMSDSQYHDEPRVWWKEAVKRRIVACFGGAFVAGSTHAAYLRRLGMPADRIRTGYDVVDNDYFTRGTDAARSEPGLRERLNLPERYFLTTARFVPNKNLAGLVDAFAEYRRLGGTWDLVIVGDGPLQQQIVEQVAARQVAGARPVPGFKQYGDLPGYFGLASAFVLTSVVEQWGLVVNEAMAAGLPVLATDVCGSAADLVRPGETGAVFPARDDRGLARLMLDLSADPARAAAMGRRGREVIAGWTPETFAANLWAAARAAAPCRPGLLSRLALRAMIRRRPFLPPPAPQAP